MFEPERCPKCREHLTYVLRATMKYQCACQKAEERMYGVKNGRRIPKGEKRK